MNDITSTLLDAFGDSLGNIAEQVTKLAQIYCDGLAADPDFRDKVLQRFPMVGASFLSRLPLANQGKLCGSMILIDHATQFQRLPLVIQQSAIDHGIDLLTPTGETRKVFPQTMDMASIRQCIAWDRIRTPEEQRAWMDKQTPKVIPARPSSQPDWEVVGPHGKRRVKILRAGVELTPLQVANIMAEMQG